MGNLNRTTPNLYQLAHQIIKNDLVNCQLIYGLGRLNIIADDYMSHLPDIVFKIMGFADEIPEPLWKVYFDFTEFETSKSNSEQTKSVDELATELLAKIMEWITNNELHEATELHSGSDHAGSDQ